MAVHPTAKNVVDMLNNHGGGVTVKDWGEFLLLFKGHSFTQIGMSARLEAMRGTRALRVETRKTGLVRVWLRLEDRDPQHCKQHRKHRGKQHRKQTVVSRAT